MQGFLEKRSGNWSIYQLRYFQREDHYLKYYAAKGDQMPRGTIDLYKLSAVRVLGGTKGRLRNKEEKHEFLLEVGSRTYAFRASNQQAMQAWLEAISVWMPVKQKGDTIKIPRKISNGLLSLLDICLREGIKVEGLFRVPGSNSAVEEIVSNICKKGRHFFEDLPAQYDVFDYGSALKKILRELAEPLFTFEHRDDIEKCKDPLELRLLLEELPKQRYDIIKHLFELFKALCDHNDVTSMHSGAINVCLAPCLGTNNGFSFTNMTSLFNLVIENFHSIYPEDIARHSEIEIKEDELEEVEKFHNSEFEFSKRLSELKINVLNESDLENVELYETEVDDELEYGESASGDDLEIDDEDVFFASLDSMRLSRVEKNTGDIAVDHEEMLREVAVEEDEEEELKAIEETFREIRSSYRLRTKDYRMMIAHLLSGVDEVLDEDLRETLVFQETRANYTKLTDAEKKLKLEKRRSTLLAARVLDLEEKLAQFQRASVVMTNRRDDVMGISERSEYLINNMMQVMEDKIIPAFQQLKKEQETQRRMFDNQ